MSVQPARSESTVRGGIVARTPTRRPSIFQRGATTLLSRLAPVEHAQHQNGAAIVTVLKSVCSAEHLENDFAVFLAACDRSPKPRMPTKKLGPSNPLSGHLRGEAGEPFVQECGKSIEVGQRVERPTRSLLARPLTEPGRAPRAQPLHHTLMWHPGTFRGPGGSTIELRELVIVRFPGLAVECGQFSDQLRNGQAKLGCSQLEHVRRVLVDLNAHMGAHGTRIADPASASGDV